MKISKRILDECVFWIDEQGVLDKNAVYFIDILTLEYENGFDHQMTI